MALGYFRGKPIKTYYDHIRGSIYVYVLLFILSHECARAAIIIERSHFNAVNTGGQKHIQVASHGVVTCNVAFVITITLKSMRELAGMPNVVSNRFLLPRSAAKLWYQFIKLTSLRETWSESDSRIFPSDS